MNNIQPQSTIAFKQTRKMQTVMIVLFQIIHLLFALNYGFINPKSFYPKFALNFFLYIKCSIISVLSVYSIYSHEGSIVTLWFSISLLTYLICVLILSFTKADVTFCNLHLELQQIDKNLKVDYSEYNLELKIVLSLFMCFLHRTVFTISFCIFTDKCIKPYWTSFVFYCVILSMEMCHVCFTFIFISASYRLNKLITILSATETNLTFLQYIYKSLIDITEKYKNAYDTVYSVALILTMPGVLMSWFFAVKNIYLANLVGMSSEFAVLIETFALTIIPAFAADTLTTQGEKIKVLLHDKLLHEQDEDKIQDMIRFIHYVEARDCRFRVCKVIPLNADLLGMVLRFCVTYLIVIIQFTHVV